MIYPTYAPDFQIRINGDDLPRAVRSIVTGVNYQDGQNASDRVEIEIANPNLRWLQRHIRGLGARPFPTGVNIGPVHVADAAPDGTFDIDNKLELDMGYAPSPLEQMFKGEITGVEASFPNGGMPSLKLIAHDYLHRLSKGTKARGFGLLPDFLIAALMGAENLLVPFIDPVVSGASTAMTVLQVIFGGSGPTKQGSPYYGESNLDLLARIAHQYDADFWVAGDVLMLTRVIKEYAPRLKLTWGESLIDFSPRMSSVGQVIGVSKKFTLREIPLSFLVTMFWDFDQESIGVSIVPGAAGSIAGGADLIIGGASITQIDDPISTPADITASALSLASTLRKKINSRLTATGSAVGNTKIRAGAVIQLDGLGPDFSRHYRVTSATHGIDSGGYRTNFECNAEIIP